MWWSMNKLEVLSNEKCHTVLFLCTLTCFLQSRYFKNTFKILNILWFQLYFLMLLKETSQFILGFLWFFSLMKTFLFIKFQLVFENTLVLWLFVNLSLQEGSHGSCYSLLAVVPSSLVLCWHSWQCQDD